MPARNTIQIEIRADDKASNTISGIGDRLQDLGKAAAIGLAAIGAAAVAAGKGLLDLAVDAASFGGIREAFEGMVESMGRGSEEMLAALQEGSAGMIDMEQLMLKFNLATQLVGDQFAQQLPDALQYLSKVASATGEDMGFLMDSLVRGVGRLSPMILDNLGIQVDLNAAYEVYAASIGKSVDELTKQEQQTALMNQVMAALAENTASMPDIFNQTDTRLARLEATMKNFRLEVGDKLQPVLDTLITWGEGFLGILRLLVLGDYTGIIGDIFGAGFEEDAPFTAILFAIRDVIQAIIAGVPVFDALSSAISDVMRAANSYGFEGLFQGLEQLNNIVVNILKPIGDWISENIQLNDILIALGIALGSIILPAIISIIGFLAPLIALFAGIVLAVAGLRKAWEEDFLGIRTFAEQTLLPLLAHLGERGLLGILQDAATAAQQLAQLGLLVVVDALNRAAATAMMLWAIFQAFVIRVFNDAKQAVLDFLASLDPQQLAGFVIGIGLIAAVLIGADLFNKFTAIAAALRSAAAGALMLQGSFLPLLGIIAVIAAITLAYSNNTFGLRDRINELGVTLRNAWTTIQQTAFILRFYFGEALNWVRARITELQTTLQNLLSNFLSTMGSIVNNPLFSLLVPNGALIQQQFNAAAQAGYNVTAPRARGGSIFGGQSYLVGERGPEIFTPGMTGSITPNGGMGSGTYQFFFQGTGGPTNEREAEDSTYMVVNSLRSRGVDV